jgi:hypothetical protein
MGQGSCTKKVITLILMSALFVTSIPFPSLMSTVHANTTALCLPPLSTQISGSTGSVNTTNSVINVTETTNKVTSNETQSLSESPFMVTSILPISPMAVAIGTPFSALVLPDFVRVGGTSNGTQSQLDLKVVWSAEGYNPNEVDGYEIRGTFVEVPAHVAVGAMRPTYTVQVLGGVVVGIADVEDVFVPFDTPFDKIELPKQIAVTVQNTTNSGVKVAQLEVPITWKSSQYDPKVVGQYEVRGTLAQLPQRITNEVSNLEAITTVHVKENIVPQIEQYYVEIFKRKPTDDERTQWLKSGYDVGDIYRFLWLTERAVFYFGEVSPVQQAFESDDDMVTIDVKWKTSESRKNIVRSLVENHFYRDNASVARSDLATQITSWTNSGMNVSVYELIQRFEIRNAFWMDDSKEPTETQYRQWLDSGLGEKKLRLAILGDEKEAAIVEPFKKLFGQYPTETQLQMWAKKTSQDATTIYDQLYDSPAYKQTKRHEENLRALTFNNVFNQWLNRQATEEELETWITWSASTTLKNDEIVPFVEKTVRVSCGGLALIKAKFAEQGLTLTNEELVADKWTLQITYLVRSVWTHNATEAKLWIEKFKTSAFSYEEMTNFLTVAKGMKALSESTGDKKTLTFDQLYDFVTKQKTTEQLYEEIVGEDKVEFLRQFVKKNDRYPVKEEFEATLVTSFIRLLPRAVPGEKPPTQLEEIADFSGTAQWTGDFTEAGAFIPDKDYTVKISLKAKSGYTLYGAYVDYFTVEGAYDSVYDSETETITAKVTSSPIAPPTKVTATMRTDHTKVTVGWKPVPAATGYELYRDDKLIAIFNNPAQNAYDDTTVEGGKTAYYRLKTVYGEKKSVFSALAFGKRLARPTNPLAVWASHSVVTERRSRHKFPSCIGCNGDYIIGNNYDVAWRTDEYDNQVTHWEVWKQQVHLGCYENVQKMDIGTPCYDPNWSLHEKVDKGRRSTTVRMSGDVHLAYRFMVVAVNVAGSSTVFTTGTALPIAPGDIDDEYDANPVAMTGWMNQGHIGLKSTDNHPFNPWTDRPDKYGWSSPLRIVDYAGGDFPQIVPFDLGSIFRKNDVSKGSMPWAYKNNGNGNYILDANKQPVGCSYAEWLSKSCIQYDENKLYFQVHGEYPPPKTYGGD